MAKLKQVHRSANMAWSPVPHSATLLATATSAGSLGDSFDASASLEILSLDVANPSADMPVVGRVEIANRVQDLAWGAQGTRSHGLLAAGFSTGAISVWDPELILTHSYVAAMSPSYFGTWRILIVIVVIVLINLSTVCGAHVAEMPTL